MDGFPSCLQFCAVMVSAEGRAAQRRSDDFCCAGVLAWKAWTNRVAAEVTFGTLWVSDGPSFVDPGVESYLYSQFFHLKIRERSLMGLVFAFEWKRALLCPPWCLLNCTAAGQLPMPTPATFVDSETWRSHRTSLSLGFSRKTDNLTHLSASPARAHTHPGTQFQGLTCHNSKALLSAYDAASTRLGFMDSVPPK